MVTISFFRRAICIFIVLANLDSFDAIHLDLNISMTFNIDLVAMYLVACTNLSLSRMEGRASNDILGKLAFKMNHTMPHP